MITRSRARAQIASIAIRPAILQLDRGSWQIVTLYHFAWTVLPLAAIMSACLQWLCFQPASSAQLFYFPLYGCREKGGYNDAVVQ